MGEGGLPLAGFFLSFIQGRIANWSHKDFANGFCFARRSHHDQPTGFARSASWAKASCP
jgi:hypothetical protein